MTAPDRIRVDKWLWVARLTKTRALATEAARAGRVKVNGVEAKPSREVGAGDELELRVGAVRTHVVIKGTAERRGPATEAQKLYEETEASREAREQYREQHRLARAAGGEGGRPTKRDRRQMQRLKGKRS